MSIAQKIYELRKEIMATHPDAKLVGIEISSIAEMMLSEELQREHLMLYAAPVELTHVPRKIKKIFDVEVIITHHSGRRND